MKLYSLLNNPYYNLKINVAFETTKYLLKKSILYLKIDFSYEFKYKIKFREVFFMKKNSLTEVVFILDRSGSMSGLEDDTIGGFNSILKKQREEDGDANVTTILFDDEIEMLHKRVNNKEIKNITSNDYYVRGCTALLDAIGYSINFMINVAKNKNEEKGRASQT